MGCMLVVCSDCMFTLLTEIFAQQERLTPLHYAACQRNADVVNLLVMAGSKVDEKETVSMN